MHGEAVFEQGKQGAVGLGGVGPGGVDKRLLDGSGGLAQHPHDLAADLPVGAREFLRARGEIGWWLTGGEPRAVHHGALAALRRARGAHERPELHQRDRKHRPVRDFGEFALARPHLGDAADRAGVHSPHVRVHHRHILAEGEVRHRARRVIADAGQREQRVHVGRHLAAMLLDDHPRALQQPQGAPRVAETAPGAQHLVGPGLGKGVRGGPARNPLPPDRGDAFDLGLVAHHFGEQHAPGGRACLAPRQVARVALVPRDYLLILLRNIHDE